MADAAAATPITAPPQADSVQLATTQTIALAEVKTRREHDLLGEIDVLQKLAERRKQLEEMERQMQMREDLLQVDRQIAEHRQFVADQRREQGEIRSKFDSDVQRFRALKSGAVKPGSP